jgi:3-oxoacyl-[acyl-carrier-protein] synthase-1
MIASGHAAGLLAMEQAVAAIRANMTDMCLIAAADSYHDQATIDWLADNNQLHGKENSWGFIPGEGAGAVLVGNTNCIQQANIEMLGHVLAVASAREQNTIKTDSICTGAGLTLAIRTALSALSSDCRVDEICCDLNGEPYRADEFTFVLARQSSRFHSPTEFVAPADCWGDMGAAAGPLHVCLALAAGHKGYARGPISLVWGSSETGERAAALLSIPVGPKPE